MEERNYESFLDIESLVEDTQLSADAVCACNIPTGMCSCASCIDPDQPTNEN